MNIFAVNVQILTDSEGNILMAKVKNGKKLHGDWQAKLGYGIEEHVEKYIMSLKRFKTVEYYCYPNDKEIYSERKKSDTGYLPFPDYTVSELYLQFGNKDIWKASLSGPSSVYCLNIGEQYSNNFMFQYSSNDLDNFVKANLKYPESQIKSNISGKVIVTFGIGENQKIGNIKIKHGINEAFDKEAMRVMNEFAKTNSKFAQIDPDHPYITKEDIAKLKAEPRYKNKNLNLVDPKYRFVATYPIEFQLK